MTLRMGDGLRGSMCREKALDSLGAGFLPSPEHLGRSEREESDTGYVSTLLFIVEKFLLKGL